MPERSGLLTAYWSTKVSMMASLLRSPALSIDIKGRTLLAAASFFRLTRLRNLPTLSVGSCWRASRSSNIRALKTNCSRASMNACSWASVSSEFERGSIREWASMFLSSPVFCNSSKKEFRDRLIWATVVKLPSCSAPLVVSKRPTPAGSSTLLNGIAARRLAFTLLKYNSRLASAPVTLDSRMLPSGDRATTSITLLSGSTMIDGLRPDIAKLFGTDTGTFDRSISATTTGSLSNTPAPFSSMKPATVSFLPVTGLKRFRLEGLWKTDPP